MKYFIFLRLVKAIHENKPLFDYVKPESKMPKELIELLSSIEFKNETCKISDDTKDTIKYSIESAEYISNLLQKYSKIFADLNTNIKLINTSNSIKYNAKQFIFIPLNDKPKTAEIIKSFVNIIETNAKAAIGLYRPVLQVFKKEGDTMILCFEEKLKMHFVKAQGLTHDIIIKQISNVFQKNLA